MCAYYFDVVLDMVFSKMDRNKSVDMFFRNISSFAWS